MKYTKFIAAALVSGTIGFGAMAQDQSVDADTVVATVNGTDITVAHVIAARQALPEQYQTLPDDALYQGIVNQLVQQELLKQSAGELGNAAKIQLENEERVAIAGIALQTLAEDAVTDEALQTAYDARFADFEGGTEYHAAHILVETEEEATAIIEELGNGADFAELAQEKSTGPSGPNGGDLGWFGQGMMVEPFEKAVVEMEAGAHSAEPVQTQFGWHVINLIETRQQQAPSLEDVREELAADIQDKAIQDAIADLETNGEVERAEGIDPAAIRNDELLQD